MNAFIFCSINNPETEVDKNYSRDLAIFANL
jgi:hypothetical protein